MFEENKPDLVVATTDHADMASAHLVDRALKRGVETVTWSVAHKCNSVVLTRSTRDNVNGTSRSLAPCSWLWARDLELTESQRERLRIELSNGHEPPAVDAARTELGLDAGKKTAIVFANFAVGASLSWESSLFDTRADWLIETARAACENDRVNWVIQTGSDRGASLRTELRSLPTHVAVVSGDSEISAASLISLMDYCVTMEDSVGIEAARLGIPVLTAGEGVIEGKGFTVDSPSRHWYRARIRQVDEIRPLTRRQIDLAERFAYAYFVSRPLKMESITIDLEPQLAEAHVNIGDVDDWHTAEDLRSIADFLNDPSQIDLLTA